MFRNYDKFDIAIALYHWLQHNWSGQDDPLYIDFCSLTAPHELEVRGSLEDFDNIEDTQLEIYNSLTDANYKGALELVMS